MAEIIVAENFPASNVSEISKLTSDANSAQAVVQTENAQNLNVDDFVLLGTKGSETGEILRIQSVSGNQLTFTSNLANKHYKNEPILKLKGERVKFYRATNVNGTIPSDGVFATIATVIIEGDQLTTSYTDTLGGSGYWYKYTFYNSVSGSETSLSDSIAVRGGDFGRFCSVEDVRIEAGMMDNVYLSDNTVADRRDDAESEVKGSLAVAGYVLPLTTVPPIVRNITKLLAAGYLLLQDYGEGAEGSNKEGKAKIKLAKDMLIQIQKREIVLVDVAQEQSLNQSTGINAWPLDETKDASEDDAGGDSIFKIKHEF